MRHLILLLLLLIFSSGQAQSEIDLIQYWFDSDFENRIELTQSNQSVNITSLDIAELDYGIHELHVRAKDENGIYSSVESSLFYITNSGLSNYEYWINDNYGSKTEGIINGNTFILNQNLTQQFNQGINTFHCRVKSEIGEWSSIETSYFFHSNDALTDFEYWINEDYNNKVQVSFQNNIFQLNQEVFESFESGINVFHCRAKSDIGIWSSVESSYFFKGNNVLSNVRYWLNDDYQNIQEHELGSPTELILIQQLLNVSPLNSGSNYFHLQFKDGDGKWSSVETHQFDYSGSNYVDEYDFVTISIDKTQLFANSILYIQGNNFTPNGGVSLEVKSNQFGPEYYTVIANNSGEISLAELIDPSWPNGLYSAVAMDVVKQKLDYETFRIVTGPPVSNNFLNLLYPSSNTFFEEDQNINLLFSDFFVNRPIYPTTGPLREYNYSVQFSLNSGTWIDIMTLQGEELIGQIHEFDIPFTFDNSGFYDFRVVDNIDNSNISSSLGIEVIDSGILESSVSYKWDHSYNHFEANDGVELKGICADGTSRFLIKLESETEQIEGVTITLSEVEGNVSPAILGKIGMAQTTNQYSNEANGFNNISFEANNINSDEIEFWYVAPDDFNRPSNVDEFEDSRIVKLTFQVNYESGLFEPPFSKYVEIVRPPLLLVHGLGGDPSTWDHLKSSSGELIKNDSRLKLAHAMKLDPVGSFDQNAINLCKVDIEEHINLSKQDFMSFQDVIYRMRSMGYACNQVDYVGHSMGGVVGRHAEGKLTQEFKRTGQSSNKFGKNYEKGFINKYITLVSPHNSSIVADFADRYIPQLGFIPKTFLSKKYKKDKNNLIFSLIKPVNENFIINTDFFVPEAIKNLRIDATQGGVNHFETSLPSHMIAGDYFPSLINNLDEIPIEYITAIGEAGDFFESANEIFKIGSKFELSNILNGFFDIFSAPTDEVSKYLKYTEAAGFAYNYATTAIDSDLVVPLNSQTAGESILDSHVTLLGSSVFHCCPHLAPQRAATDNDDAGQKIIDLLNTEISSSEFDNIPATDNFLPIQFPNLNPDLVLMDSISSEFVSISSNSLLNEISVDSIISISAMLWEDTVTRNVTIYFQDQVFNLQTDSSNVKFNIPANSSQLGSSELLLYANYRLNEDTLIQFYDTLNFNVVPNSQLLDFHCNKEVLYLRKNEIRYPGYYAVFEDFITPILNFSEDINVTIENESIVEYIETSKSYKGISDGITYAAIEYENIYDTLHLVVSGSLSADSSIIDFIDEIGYSSERAQEMLISPNPTNDFTNIEFEATKSEKVEIRLINLYGSALYRDQRRVQPGKNRFDIDVSGYPPGGYLIEVRGESLFVSGTLIIQ